MTNLTTTKLNALNKATLVSMTGILVGKVGDYARLPKEHFVDTLSGFTLEEVDNALEQIINSKEVPTMPTYKLKAEKVAMLEIKPATEKQPASQLEAAQNLIALLSQTKGIDEDAVNRLIEARTDSLLEIVKGLIDSSFDNLELPVQTIVISPKAEVKIEAHTPAYFKKMTVLAGLRKNILLVGPAGCGKTTVAHLLATALELPFSSISCSAGMSEGQLLGRLLPIGEAGRFEYVASEFVKAYENGGVFLIDELDASDENTLIILNQALANGGFYLPSRTENPYCKRHADFICIAAANTFGHGADMVYAGRNKLDGATLDRFRAGMIVVDYDRAYEAQRCNKEVLAWGLELRAEIDGKRLRRIASTRVLADFSDMIAAGLTMQDCKQAYFSDWSKDELAKISLHLR